jgi:hypothetical protein
MHAYAIIEVSEGMTVAELPPTSTAEEKAARLGAVLIDPGPYPSYDEAYDALLSLQEDEDEEE